MKLRHGYELIYDFPQPTPAIRVVNVHSSQMVDILQRVDVCCDYAHHAIVTTFGPTTLHSFRVWSDKNPETPR